MNQQYTPQLGIRANFPQFSLLVLINAFVGAMVGMERSILPLIAGKEFGIASHSAILSFLISFGVVKAFSNLLAGRLSDRVGRKKLLVAGWVIGLPVPFMLMWAPSWSWVVVANMLLGVNQGLCWSTTVIMKIDLAGPKQRGLAMGLNEFAGYVAVAIAAFLTAIIADHYGLRPAPFYLGIGLSLAGCFLSAFFVRETHSFTQIEAEQSSTLTSHLESQTIEAPSFGKVFTLTSWRNKNLFSCSQAGLINNLNDGMAWGLLPLLFASLGFSLRTIGLLAGIYPAAWGIAQLLTGAMSDTFGRKWLIVLGMWVQACAIILIVMTINFSLQMVAAVLLGLGTAMVYPTLLAAVSDASYPAWRATAVGVYRLWRDLGYALGAILSGILADEFGVDSAILLVGTLTFISGGIVAIKFQETNNQNINSSMKGTTIE